jgi:hypothetical protein
MRVISHFEKSLWLYPQALWSESTYVLTSVVDPDPAFQFQFDADLDPDPTTHYIGTTHQIWTLNAPKWPSKASTFHFDADPDPALHFGADPDSASQNDAFQCGSWSATLAQTLGIEWSDTGSKVCVEGCDNQASLEGAELWTEITIT